MPGPDSWEQALRMGERVPERRGHPEEAALTANLAFLNLLEGPRWIIFQLGLVFQDHTACITFTFFLQTLLCTHLEPPAAYAAG